MVRETTRHASLVRPSSGGASFRGACVLRPLAQRKQWSKSNQLPAPAATYARTAWVPRASSAQLEQWPWWI